jgi:YVTN family beta-propeller protein
MLNRDVGGRDERASNPLVLLVFKAVSRAENPGMGFAITWDSRSVPTPPVRTSMRISPLLLASLVSTRRAALRGLTLSVTAALVTSAGCDGAPEVQAPQMTIISVPQVPLEALAAPTPFEVTHDLLSTPPTCLSTTHNDIMPAGTSLGGPLPVPEGAQSEAQMGPPERARPRAPRALGREEASPWRSGRAIASQAEAVFVVDTDNGALVELDTGTFSVTRRVLLGATTRPEQVVVGPNGTAWVTLRHAHSVVRIPAGDDQADLNIAVGFEPFGLAMSPDGSRLYVTLAGEDELVVLDAETGLKLMSVDTAPHPRGVVFTDRQTVAVVHTDSGVREWAVGQGGTLEGEAVDTAVRTGNPWQLVSEDPFSAEFSGEDTPALSHYGTRAVAVTTDPERGDVYVAHVQVAPGTVDQLVMGTGGILGIGGSPTPPPDEQDTPQGEDPKEEPQQPGGYGMGASTRFGTVFRPVEPSITRLHALGTKGTMGISEPISNMDDEVLAHRLDQPMDLHHHPNTSLLFMVGQGTDNVLVFNSAMSDPMASPVAEISVGQGPKAITFSPDGLAAYVLNSHDYTIGSINLTSLIALASPETEGCDEELQQLTGTATLSMTSVGSFGEDTSPVAVQRGRRIFHNARNSHLNSGDEFACATCHLEGTEDKQVWLVPGGERQTPSLAGRLMDTAPFNWTGSEQALQDNMSETILRMGGLGLSAQELSDLEQFLLHGLVAPPNPHRVGDTLSEEQAFGKTIFERGDVGCANCHAGDATTDGLSHDVGTESVLETHLRELMSGLSDEASLSPALLNTPSLRGLFYTAPYLHDGSAATLREVLAQTATTMGRTDHLSEDELEALMTYLLTL